MVAFAVQVGPEPESSVGLARGDARSACRRKPMRSWRVMRGVLSRRCRHRVVRCRSGVCTALPIRAESGAGRSVVVTVQDLAPLSEPSAAIKASATALLDAGCIESGTLSVAPEPVGGGGPWRSGPALATEVRRGREPPRPQTAGHLLGVVPRSDDSRVDWMVSTGWSLRGRRDVQLPAWLKAAGTVMGVARPRAAARRTRRFGRVLPAQCRPRRGPARWASERDVPAHLEARTSCAAALVDVQDEARSVALSKGQARTGGRLNVLPAAVFNSRAQRWANEPSGTSEPD